jgi:hypothetical protein
MAMAKPKGNKNYGGKKTKGRTNKGKGSAVAVNRDVKASRAKNSSLYTTKKTTKKKTGTGTTTAKMRSASKSKAGGATASTGRIPRRRR